MIFFKVMICSVHTNLKIVTQGKVQIKLIVLIFMNIACKCLNIAKLHLFYQVSSKDCRPTTPHMDLVLSTWKTGS